MTLPDLLIDQAENIPACQWPATVRLAAPHASDVNVSAALHAMSMWAAADNPMSRAFAGHAIDKAASRLLIRAVAS